MKHKTKSTLPMPIPNSLRKYRRLRGLTQADVARIMHFQSTVQLSQWEKGIAVPRTFTASKLARLYHTQFESLYPDMIRVWDEEIHQGEEQLASSKSQPP